MTRIFKKSKFHLIYFLRIVYALEYEYVQTVPKLMCFWLGYEYNPCASGCEINCQNYKDYEQGGLICTEPITEACVCPYGQVK